MRSSPASERSAKPEVRETRVGGALVRHRAAGAGPPLVCLHGLAGSSRWWAPVVPALTERREVHLLDLPGFGGLGRRSRRVPLAAAAGWLVDWADAAGLARFDLAGHSVGAAIAVRVAAERPERIRRLADLRRVAAPTLVVCGARDALVPPSVGELVRREWPLAGLVVLERAAHVPMLERPAECADALVGFLEGEERPDRSSRVPGT